MSAATRLLVLGIDAANPALLQRWAGDGTLPALGTLFEHGVVARTRGVDGFFVGSTWPTFATGLGPARHGVHYLVQLRPGSYSYERVADRPAGSETFWMTASRAGRRVAVLDVPLSRVTLDLNGIQTVEWGGHDHLYGFQTSPTELRDEIISKFGPHPLQGTCDARRRTGADYEQFVGRLVQGALLKGRLTRNLLGRGEWDLFVQVFTEAHCAGHQCWHIHDAEHPSHDAGLAAEIGDPLLRVYQAIDEAIGDIIGEAGDALVIVVVAHGMAHQYGAQSLLPEILFRLGATARPTWRMSSRRSIARQIWHKLPEHTRERLEFARRRLPSAVPINALPPLSADPERSLCFPVANGFPVGGIRLNLIGREPAGVLEPGAATDRFCDQLAADLTALEDAQTGRPLVRRVSRTAEFHDGPLLACLPDLLVEWRDEGPVANTVIGPADAAIVRATSRKSGLIEGANEWGRTGEHRPDGLIAASGPGLTRTRLGEVGLVDIAPTILALLGIDCCVDGKPIPEIVVGG